MHSRVPIVDEWARYRREHSGRREYRDADMFKEVAHELGLFWASPYSIWLWLAGCS
jgi:hypothetical protein